MGLSSEISHYIIPAIRYKESSINILNEDRSTRSEIPHSESWVGWGENTLLINMPIFGDTKNNKVIYYDLPNNAGTDFMQKMSFDEGHEYSSQCNKLSLPYEVGKMYICDVSVIHSTERMPNSKGRLSIDIPLEFKYHKTIQNNFLKSHFISAQEMQLLGKNFKLSFPSRMGQIDNSEFHKKAI